MVTKQRMSWAVARTLGLALMTLVILRVPSSATAQERVMRPEFGAGIDRNFLNLRWRISRSTD